MQTTPTPPYEIGGFYEVPVVIVPKNQNWTFWGMKTIPVIGPPHNDDKLLDVIVGPHIHCDWRFAPKLSIAKVLRSIDQCYDPLLTAIERQQYILGRVLAYSDILIHGTARLRCKRDFPKYPEIVHFGHNLRQKYAGAKFTGKCPHWGVDLSRIKPDADGCVTCPLHGLRFNLSTGRMAEYLQPIDCFT